MRILIDTTYARRGPTGTGVYLQRLLPALRAAGVEVLEAANPRRGRPGGGGWRSVRNAGLDAAWLHGELPRRALRADVDLVHHPLPALARGLRRPQVVTVHDLAFEVMPDAFDPRWRALAARQHAAAARGAAAVVAVSHATAEELLARWGVAAVVAPHGPGQDLPDVPPRPPGHLLYVGDAEPRKDLPTLLEAVSSLPLPVVLAGRLAPGAFPGVRVVPEPSAHALAELYAGAAALVHPSRHEGFGLTLVEAMRAGVPVVAADVPAAREVCSGAAVLFRPGDPAALAAAVAEALARGEELRATGRARAAVFTWERSAAAHVAAYERALGG